MTMTCGGAAARHRQRGKEKRGSRRSSAMWRSTALMLLAALLADSTVLAEASAPSTPQIHRVPTTHYYQTFDRRHSVLERVRAGDTIITQTLDAFGNDEHGVQRGPLGNPLTGPLYVEGAAPGDALVVRIDGLRLNRNWGFTLFRLGLFALLPESIEHTYPNRYKPDLVHKGWDNLVFWDIDLKRQTVALREPKSQIIKLEFATKPMLGCIGVAPAGDFAPTSDPSGAYGGNLDYNEITEGATVLLPVYQPGGLLFVGDGHAVQGDGETMGTGVETSLDVQLTVGVRKRAHLTGPRVENAEYIISVGSQPEFASSLDRALQMATSDMVEWLTSEYKLEPWVAHLLIGQQGRYDVVTAAGSMALKIPKSALRAH